MEVAVSGQAVSGEAGRTETRAPTNRAGLTKTSKWTTGRWLSAGVGATLVVLIALGVLGTWLLTHATSVNSRLVDRSTPALIAGVRLDAALVSQETGVRGYGMTGRTEFLEPYRLGIRAQDDAVRELRRLLAADGDPTPTLDTLLERAGTWRRTYADTVVATPPGAPVAFATERAGVGKSAFDALRAASGALQDHLTTSRLQARSDLIRVRTQRNWTFGAIAAVILAVALLMFVGLRRAVSSPLGRLADDAERVAAGDFDHAIRSSGPADIQALAATVELMRSRLVDALDASEQARRRIDAQAEDLRRSNTDLEQFAYVASHDLQEPLRKVVSFCQLLQRRYTGQLDDRADQYIGFVIDGATRMQKLIQDLLAFSRVGRGDEPMRAVELDRVYGGAADSLDLAAREAGARLTRDPLPAVTGNAAQLEMLLTNLLGNAIKFRHPDRAPTVHVGADRDGDLWRITVTDNGIGIEPQYADRVFVIFQRLHARDEYPGTGIGLAMCKKIVEYHGGRIGIDDQYSDGTRMWFTLPAT